MDEGYLHPEGSVNAGSGEPSDELGAVRGPPLVGADRGFGEGAVGGEVGALGVRARLHEAVDDVLQDAAVAVHVVPRVGGAAGEALGGEVAGAASAFAGGAGGAGDAEVAEDGVVGLA